MEKQQVLLTLDTNFHFKLTVAALAKRVTVAELLNDVIDSIIDKKEDDMQLFIGAIVHYMSYGTPNGEFEPEVRPAIVTEIHENNQISATVFQPQGWYVNNLKFAETPTPGHWSFIPDEPYEKVVGELPSPS